MRNLFCGAALASLLALGLTASASASSITFDFGNAPASESVNANGIFQGGGTVDFTESGVSLGATGYGGFAAYCIFSGGSCLASKYVSQKPGTFGSGETGIGESNQQNRLSDSDREITSSTYLVLDNRDAIAHGYTTSDLSFSSLQDGEGVHVYALDALTPSFFFGDLLNTDLLTASNLAGTLIGCTAPGCTGGSVQSLLLDSASPYFVITALPRNANGSGANDIALAQDVVSTPAPVPEPMTLSLFGAGLAGLGFLMMRRRRT